MNCIKIGALIYFVNYGEVVRGDIYAVGNCYVIRWNPQSVEYCTQDEVPQPHWTVLQVGDSSAWWHRDDLGVTVVPKDFVLPGLEKQDET